MNSGQNLVNRGIHANQVDHWKKPRLADRIKLYVKLCCIFGEKQIQEKHPRYLHLALGLYTASPTSLARHFHHHVFFKSVDAKPPPTWYMSEGYFHLFCVCLRCFITFYHGKSPQNHHFFLPSIKQANLSCVIAAEIQIGGR